MVSTLTKVLVKVFGDSGAADSPSLKRYEVTKTTRMIQRVSFVIMKEHPRLFFCFPGRTYTYYEIFIDKRTHTRVQANKFALSSAIVFTVTSSIDQN